MKKKRNMILPFIVFVLCLLTHPTVIQAQDEAKVEIWSNSLDERIEHRNVEVGHTNPNFQMKVTPAGTVTSGISWSTGNSGIAGVSWDGTNATVSGNSEGTTKLKLSVNTGAYGKLTDDCIISVYTAINNVPGNIRKATTLYRGASDSAWVRTERVKVGQKLTIIGSCGKYWYINMPSEYEFDDHRTKRDAYVLKSDVYVPVSGVFPDQDNFVLEEGESEWVSVQLQPDIATDQDYDWQSSDENVAWVDDDLIMSGNEGFAIIRARSSSDGKEGSCHVSVYTPVDVTKGHLDRDTVLYAGADESCNVVKSDAKKGMQLNVVGKCGQYYYVEFPEESFGEDGDNMAFVRISDVYIPVEWIELSDENLILNVNQTKRLTVTVYPELATDKRVEFWTKADNVAVDGNGNVTVKKETAKDDTIYVKSLDGEESGECTVQILPDKIIEQLDPNNTFTVSGLETDLDGNYVTFSECAGASEYIVLRGTGGKWEDIYYAYNNDSKEYRYVFDAGAQLGKTYSYKIVAYYKYVTYKNEKLVTERVTKTILSGKVKTGQPQLKGNVVKNKKGIPQKIKLSWNKMSYDYEKGIKKGGYILSRKAGSGKNETIKTIHKKKTLSFTDKKIKTNKKYTYHIKAFYINKAGKKICSPSRSITLDTKSPNKGGKDKNKGKSKKKANQKKSKSKKQKKSNGKSKSKNKDSGKSKGSSKDNGKSKGKSKSKGKK